MASGLAYVQTSTAVSPQDDIDEDSGQNCKKCGLSIREGHAYELGGDRWHTHCFNCSKCSRLLGVNSNFLVLGTGALVCSECSYSCKSCNKKIYDLAILTGDDAYCSSCFRCRSCKRQIEDLRYARTSKGLFCMSCHERLIARKKTHDAKKLLKPIDSSEGSTSATSSMYDKTLPEPPTTTPSTQDQPESDDNSSISIPVRSPKRSETPSAHPTPLNLDSETQAQYLARTPEETPVHSSLSPMRNIKSNANRKAVVMEEDEYTGSMRDFKMETDMKGLNIANVPIEPSTPKRSEVTPQPSPAQSHSRKSSGSGLGRAFSIRSPKAKQMFNFHRHKRSISGNLDLNDTKEETVAAFSTPPLPSSDVMPQHSHSRSASDTGEFKASEQQLASLQAEVNHLIHKKTSLMRDLETLELQKSSLKTDIALMQEQYKKMEAEMHAKSLDSTDESADVFEKNSASSSFQTEAVPIPDEESATEKSRQRARFWKRGKNTKLSQSPSYQNALGINEDESTELEHPTQGFLSSMIKSRSNNFLSLRNAPEVQPKEPVIVGKDLYKSSLAERAEYENRSIPFIFERCIDEVEKRGLDSEGIYRISGASSAIDRLETAFKELDLANEMEVKNLNKTLAGDINCVTGTVKRYLGKLTNPVIPFDCYETFIGISSLEDLQQQKEALRQLLQRLPEANRAVLLKLAKHLNLVAQNGLKNRMNVHNLAVVFAPTIAKYQGGDPSREMVDMGARSAATELIFLYYDYVLESEYI